MKRSRSKAVRNLRLNAWLNALLGLGALWVVAFALTGDELRAGMFCVALALAQLCYQKSRKQSYAADILEKLPFFEQFDQEMKNK